MRSKKGDKRIGVKEDFNLLNFLGIYVLFS